MYASRVFWLFLNSEAQQESPSTIAGSLARNSIDSSMDTYNALRVPSLEHTSNMSNVPGHRIEARDEQQPQHIHQSVF